MKRLLIMLLCVVLLIACTACFRAPDVETPTKTSDTTTTTTTASSATTTTTTTGVGEPSGSTTTTTTTGAGEPSGTTTTTTAADPNAPGVVGFTSYPATGWATDSLIVRDAPSKEGKYIGGLAKGSDITVLGKEGDWYRISYNSAEVGWTDAAYVNANYITSVEPQ